MNAMRDRFGRYFFRPEDLRKGKVKIVPGYYISHPDKPELILEVDSLYVGEEVAAIQVSVQKED